MSWLRRIWFSGMTACASGQGVAERIKDLDTRDVLDVAHRARRFKTLVVGPAGAQQRGEGGAQGGPAARVAVVHPPAVRGRIRRQVGPCVDQVLDKRAQGRAATDN